jgi:hypothetical protein
MEFKATMGTEPKIIEELTVKLHSAGMNGGTCFDILVGRNLPVELVYSYTPGASEDGEEVSRASVKIAAIKAISPPYFESDSGMLSYGAGYDLLPIMLEVEVEALEEELLKKLEAR